MVGPSLVIDATAARTGGGPSRIRELLRTLTTLAPQTELSIYTGPKMVDPIDVPADVAVHELPSPISSAPLRVLWQNLALPRLLRKNPPEWILSPFNVLPLGGRLDPRTRTALIVSSLHPFDPEVSGALSGYQSIRIRILRRLTLASIKRADKVFLLSQEAQRRLGSILPADKVTRLPMAPPNPTIVSAACALPLPRQLTGMRYFVCAGDLMAHKGFEDAVLAVANLHQRGFPARLAICGTSIDASYERRLWNLAQSQPDAFVFTGSLGHAHMLRVMQRAVAMVFSSRSENPSRVPIEAATMDCPIVAVDRLHAVEHCADGADYYKEADPVCLADRLQVLLEDETYRQHLIERGRQRFLTIDYMEASRVLLRSLGLLNGEPRRL